MHCLNGKLLHCTLSASFASRSWSWSRCSPNPSTLLRSCNISRAAESSSSSSASHHPIKFPDSKYKMAAVDFYKFGPYKIDPKEVFYSTDFSYAMVNLRPLVPGHVLVCPKREVQRFVDLTAAETGDLWLTAQKVGSRLEQHHQASSLTFAIQDGPQAGQTVPHVHVHILPRKGGDFEKNDEIYDAIDKKEKELKSKLDLDKAREDRSLAEMAEEAEKYRTFFIDG